MANGTEQGAAAPRFRFWLATQAIIVGLAIKAALEQVHENVGPGMLGHEPFSLERTLVYASFAILLVRFYGGALRFGNLDDIPGTTFTEIKNFVGASALFSLFFLMAMSVNDTWEFLRFVFLLHAIDGIWFVATYVHSHVIGAKKRQKVSGFFLILTIVTIILVLVAPPLVTLWGLIGISLFDFAVFWPFYSRCEARFSWQKWRGSMKLYLAAPFGFSEAGRYYVQHQLRPHFQALGHRLIDPFDPPNRSEIDRISQMSPGVERLDAWKAMNPIIGRQNRESIDVADAVFAILDGVDVDSGTASEVGYAFAKGKRIWGYRGDFRLSADNEGSIVNLQVEHFIVASGGRIFTRLEDVTKDSLSLE